ncbi:PREDICTED: uncharacterized protein LOC108609631 [Drosophila arizonae]|uniref:Uncharacterized protein LOC108609631 n=1 Tax=Drosophila arizonae TaxID=7263 RepID=A0ABM1NPF5_DROAR|nr:PREDICTED: uncharacterized protein LOC108609631 [Drosophila arizonae]
MLQQCHSPQAVDDTRTSAIHSLQLQQRQQRQLSVWRGESWTVALPCPCGGRASNTHISVQPQAMHAAGGGISQSISPYWKYLYLLLIFSRLTSVIGWGHSARLQPNSY